MYLVATPHLYLGMSTGCFYIINMMKIYQIAVLVVFIRRMDGRINVRMNTRTVGNKNERTDTLHHSSSFTTCMCCDFSPLHATCLYTSHIVVFSVHRLEPQRLSLQGLQRVRVATRRNMHIFPYVLCIFGKVSEKNIVTLSVPKTNEVSVDYKHRFWPDHCTQLQL